MKIGVVVDFRKEANRLEFWKNNISINRHQYIDLFFNGEYLNNENKFMEKILEICNNKESKPDIIWYCDNWFIWLFCQKIWDNIVNLKLDISNVIRN